MLDGGFDGAERRIACFGSGQLCRDERKAPICCVCITPLSQKFAEPLTHRDYLGALMALGIRRALLGDLVLSDGSAYLFCMDSICGFLTDELSRVKHTAVRCQVAQPPSCQAQTPPVTAVNVASGRLDAMVAAVFHLSRADSQRLFAQEKVFRNSRVCLAPDACAAEGEIISVRGFGRFVYEGVEKQTRSGRLRILVRR
jgi:RNA-binding protein YlmH